MKQRLDILLVEQGLAASREKAKAMIMSGVVFVNGQREDKAGSTFDEKAAATIEIHGSTLRYVSRIRSAKTRQESPSRIPLIMTPSINKLTENVKAIVA